MNKTYTTKLQYRQYETGEFTDSKKRTLTEIEELILNYPWLQQCHNTSVELTAPSVTVENEAGCFLKISHYYHNKFSIYYLSEKDDCYIKIGGTVEECLPQLQAFCDGKLSVNDFKKDHHSHPRKHFESKSFRYGFRMSAVISLIFLSLFMIGFSLPLLFIFTVINESDNIPLAAWLLISLYTLFSMFCVWTVLAIWIAFFDHYKQYKNHFLEIANGGDAFSFGTDDNYKTYNKSDIATIDQIVANNKIIREPRFGRYSPKTSYFMVTFNNNEQIKISALLYPDAAKLYFVLKGLDMRK